MGKAHRVPMPWLQQPAVAEPEPEGAGFGNDYVQMMLGLGRYKPTEAGDSTAPTIASHAPHRDPQAPGGYVRHDYGATTIGRGRGAADDQPGGSYVRLEGKDGHTQIGGGVHREDKDGKGVHVSGGADIDWEDPGKSGLRGSWRRSQTQKKPEGPETDEDKAARQGVDEDGDVAHGAEISGRVSLDGVEVAGRHAVGQNKVDAGVKLGRDGVGVKGGFESASGRGGGMSISGGNGRGDFSVEVKPFNDASVSAGFHFLDQDGFGASRNPFLPGGYEVSNLSGGGMEGSLSIEKAGAGGGITGSMASRDHVAHQRSEARIRKDFVPVPGFFPTWDSVVEAGQAEAYLAARYRQGLGSVKSIADVDLGKLATGEGYTFQHDEDSSKGVNGRYGPLTVGFGDKDLSMSRTSVARDEKGWKIQLQMADTDEDMLQGGISQLKMSEVTTESKSHLVELSIADTPGGQQALRQFQRAGLLPGADKLADPDDEDRQDYEQALNAYEYMDALTQGKSKDLPLLRKELFESSAKLNARVLGQQGRQLMQAPPSGVTYHSHLQAHTEATKTEVELAGYEIADSGISKTGWHQDYQGKGKLETRDGHTHEQDWIIGGDESASIAADSQDGSLVLASEQDVDDEDRERLDDLGAGGMDSVRRRAWAAGDTGEDDQARITLKLDARQLDTIRDRLGPKGDDFEQLVQDAEFGIDRYGPRAFNFMPDTATRRHVLAVAEREDITPQGANSAAKDVVRKVTSAESFQDLSYHDKRLFLVAAAQGGQYRDEWKAGTDREHAQPWRVLPLALQVKDPDQRNQLLRDLFAAVEESSMGSTCSVMQLLEFVHQDGRRAGLTWPELLELTSGLSVELDDEGMDERLQVMKDPKSGLSELASGLLASGWEVPEGQGFRIDREKAETARGAAMTDWLSAAERVRGPRFAAEGLRVAMIVDPTVLPRLVEDARHEPWRRVMIAELLERGGFDLDKELAKFPQE